MDGGFGHFIDQLLDEGRTQAMQKLSQLIGGPENSTIGVEL